ncbi:MAG: right-handed parallel beta-helix repeat-containing protein, partial [bacterium]|nr:right-handed parallel beta-helix repeat-containing protein [bacterium]
YGLYATGGALSTVRNNTFRNNGYQLRVEAASLHRVTDNSFSGGGGNRLRVAGGSLATAVTMYGDVGLEGYSLQGDLTVPAGVTLTVAPEAQVMGEDGAELRVSGHLEAVGTDTRPITFTSATDTGPYQWAGLVFDGGTGELRHATVRYAGDDNSLALNASGIAARNVSTGAVRIESSAILTNRHQYAWSPAYGLYADDSHVVVSDTLFSNNGHNTSDYAIYATGSSTVITVTGSDIRDNASYGLYATGGALST